AASRPRHTPRVPAIARDRSRDRLGTSRIAIRDIDVVAILQQREGASASRSAGTQDEDVVIGKWKSIVPRDPPRLHLECLLESVLAGVVADESRPSGDDRVHRTPPAAIRFDPI